MEDQIYHQIDKAYAAFNARDIDTALSTFHKEVQWPKAFEGGYVKGHDEVRKYWTGQWLEINPIVNPISIERGPSGSIVVTVHQVVRDLTGNLLFDGLVKHVYLIEDGLLRKMDIEQNI